MTKPLEAERHVVVTSADRLVAVRMTLAGNVEFRFSEQIYRHDEHRLGAVVTAVVQRAQLDLLRKRRAELGEDQPDSEPGTDPRSLPELSELEGVGRSPCDDVKARWRAPHAAEVRYRSGILRDSRTSPASLAEDTATALHNAMRGYGDALAELLLGEFDDSTMEGRP